MKRVTFVLGVLLLVALARSAWPIDASFFEVGTVEELQKGKLDDLVAREPGRLTLALAKEELLKAEGEIIWSLAVDAAGAVYAGTSHKGQIYVIRDGKSSVAGTVDDTALFAVVVGRDGRLYVGGSPSGTIYRDGQVFCKTGESYIWGMLFDDAGRLYVATGPDGKLLRIDAAGNVTVVLDSPDAHLMSLARDSGGNIYAGSSTSGLIYRLDVRDGTSKVIYDAAEGEIRAMVVDEEDRLYFGTADVTAGRTPSPGPVGVRVAAAASSAASGEGEAKEPPPAAPAPPAPLRDDVNATNAVYRLSPDGSVVKLHSIRGKMVMSMLWREDKLYVGTANRGDLMLIDENLDVTVLEKDLEEPVIALASARGGGVLLGTGDAGRVVRYGPGFVKEGQQTSQVFDAKFPARFGVITWTGNLPPGTFAEVTTQTGNVAEPDASWSEWSKPYRATGRAVTSPGARFIRYRLKLRTVTASVTPEIDRVRIAYLTGNQPPRVKSVKVTTSAHKNEKTKKPSANAAVNISWQAEDPNGDKMQYVVEFRMRGDTAWRVLEEETDKTSYAWKTDAVPDGTYEVRITASDEADNPKASALRHVRASQPFLVDNTRPSVVVAVRPGAGKATAEVTMTDTADGLKSAEYSVDSGDWRKLSPDDGIFDSPIEQATVELSDLALGEHTVTVRVYDASGNVGAGGKTFRIR